LKIARTTLMKRAKRIALVFPNKNKFVRLSATSS
jgi:hypothetical protein